MKKWIGAAAVLAFLGSGIALGQKSAVESTSKEKTSHGTTKTKAMTVTGIVKDYEAGKEIEVSGPKDKTYKFKLDENVAMKGPVQVGDRVKVSYTKTDGGEKVTTVVVYPPAPHQKTS